MLSVNSTSLRDIAKLNIGRANSRLGLMSALAVLPLYSFSLNHKFTQFEKFKLS